MACVQVLTVHVQCTCTRHSTLPVHVHVHVHDLSLQHMFTTFRTFYSLTTHLVTITAATRACRNGMLQEYNLNLLVFGRIRFADTPFVESPLDSPGITMTIPPSVRLESVCESVEGEGEGEGEEEEEEGEGEGEGVNVQSKASSGTSVTKVMSWELLLDPLLA